MILYAEVVFPLPLGQSFFYIIPPKDLDGAKPGVRVIAPLGQKMQAGFIVQVHERRPSGEVPLKEIREVIDDEAVFSPAALSFTRRLSLHYCSSWGEFLQAMLPPSLEIKTSAKVRLTEKGIEALQNKTLSTEEKKVAEILGTSAYSAFYLRRKTGMKSLRSLILRMEKKGLVQVLETKRRPKKREQPPIRGRPTQLELDFLVDPAVRSALDAMVGPLEKKTFAPFYFFGDREARRAAYVHLIRSVLASSRQVLYLLPELAPSGPLRDMLEERLGEAVGSFHGQMPEKARELEWQNIKAGARRVAVGPRSVLFAPAENVGLIIVDEEQDEAYVQSESPAYDARRGAWLLATERGSLLVSGSDVPTVEAFHRARAGNYLITLAGSGEKKNVLVADDRSERGLLTRALRDGLLKNLSAGRPSLVFSNRRGYASLLFCPRCGHIPKCKRCDISLAYYKKEERLVCRYCNDSRPKTPSCPACGSRVMEPRGVGTEAVEEELRRLFSRARISSFDSDRMKTKAAREKVLRHFRERKIDILVGTQMLAYQTELPPAAMVGIINPEALLAFPDFRASQKTFQAIHRLMRFAASGDSEVEIVIQTAFPDHYSIREAARQDYLAYFGQEIKFRRLMSYPPFAAMAEVVLMGRDQRPLARKARDLVSRVRTFSRDIEILGPAVSPPSPGRGERGVQVILKSRESETLNGCLAECLKTIGSRRSVVRYD